MCSSENVVNSTAKTEYSGIFHKCQKSIIILQVLEVLGRNSHRVTKVKTNNLIAIAFVHSTMYSKYSKAWDMKWNWLQLRIQQMKFGIIWDEDCRGSSSDTTANKINPIIWLVNFFIYLFFYTNLSVAKYRWYISVQG